MEEKSFSTKYLGKLNEKKGQNEHRKIITGMRQYEYVRTVQSVFNRSAFGCEIKSLRNL